MSFPWVKAAVGVGGRKEGSHLLSWQRGREESEVGRSWFPRRRHHVGYSPSLWNWLPPPHLGVFWQASCHGDVNVQHHPLNPPPQRIRHIFPFSLASQHWPLPWRRHCSVLSSRSLPRKWRSRKSRHPQLCKPPPQWPFSSIPKRTGIRDEGGVEAGEWLYGLPNGHCLLLQENSDQGTEPSNP